MLESSFEIMSILIKKSLCVENTQCDDLFHTENMLWHTLNYFK